MTSRKKERDIIKEKNYEIHHIIPKCLEGSNDEKNLVKLSYREHFIAHWLLIKIYSDNVKINYAFLCMLRDSHGNRKLTSRMIETIKKNYSEFKKWHSKIDNPGKSIKSREKSKARMMSELNPMKVYPEKNHTALVTKVYYKDGSIKTFSTKKEFMSTIFGLTHTQKRYKIENNNLLEYDIIKVEFTKKQNKPSEACVGRKWFTNGKNNKFVFPNEQPEGYFLGMTKRKVEK
jgi:hypothetical protein